MGTTTNHSLRYPENVSPVAVPDDIKKLAQDVDAKLISSAGGTVSGNTAFTGTVTAQTPSANNHVATKQYVDTQLSPVTATANGALPKSLVDAKGDILVGTANDTPARLAVGINGTLLTADSSTASGLKWTSRVFLEGTGSPEGVITAPPGSTYLQTDSVVDVKGWIRWIKSTGTGNTGWIAGPEADTGRRDVTASLINGWASSSGGGKLILRRIGNQVTLTGYEPGLTAVSKTSDTFYNPPSGFQEPWQAYGAYGMLGVALNHSNGALVPILRSSDAGLLAAGNTWTSVTMNITWTTEDAWPTSLPGTNDCVI